MEEALQAIAGNLATVLTNLTAAIQQQTAVIQQHVNGAQRAVGRRVKKTVNAGMKTVGDLATKALGEVTARTGEIRAVVGPIKAKTMMPGRARPGQEPAGPGESAAMTPPHFGPAHLMPHSGPPVEMGPGPPSGTGMSGRAGVYTSPTSPGSGTQVRPGQGGRDFVPPPGTRVVVSGAGDERDALSIPSESSTPGSGQGGNATSNAQSASSSTGGSATSSATGGSSSATANTGPVTVAVNVTETQTGNGLRTGGGDRERLPEPAPRVQVEAAGDEAADGPAGRAPAPARDKPAPCNLPDLLAEGIPTPGGERWCRIQEQVRGLLAQLGQQMADMVLSAIDQVGPLADPSNAIWSAGTDITNPFRSAAIAILTAAQQVGVDVRGRLREIVTCWRHMVGLLGKCDPAVVFGLTVVRGVVRAMRHFRIGVNIVVQGHLQLALDLETLDRAVTYLIEAACPTQIPSVDLAIQTHLMTDLDTDIYQCWMNAHGASTEVWEKVAEARSQAARPQDTILAARLEGLADDQVEERLRERGWIRDRDRAALVAAYNAPPQPAELMAWAQANMDPTAHPEDWAVDVDFAEWWASPAGKVARAQGLTRPTALGRWRSSWGNVPTSAAWRQAIRTAGGDPDIVTPHGSQQYQPLTLGDAATLWAQGQQESLDPEKVARDAGYTEVDAQRLGKSIKWGAARQQAMERQVWTIAQLAEIVRMNVATADDIRPVLSIQGYTQEELTQTQRGQAMSGRAKAILAARSKAAQMTASAALTSYKVGMTDAETAARQLVAAGWDAPSASAALAATDASYLAADTARQLRSLTRAFLRGMMSAQQFRVYLDRAGIQPGRRDQVVNAALVAQTAVHPQISAAKVGQLVEAGLLTEQQGLQRLTNLGYLRPDAALLAGQWRAKLRTAAARAATNKQKAALAALKAARAVTRSAQAVIRRMNPPGSLRKWYTLGIVTREYAHSQLTQMGYVKETADHYLSQWDAERAAGGTKTKKAKPATAKPGAAAGS